MILRFGRTNLRHHIQGRVQQKIVHLYHFILL